ncbi:MAG: OB-fold domain-containing protein [Gammaproteobacteria bacterium]|nr:OB-fold domain-containing protein [Gammaproteobacteria bacterium]MBK7519964.1 OB-fold domain-containing protein [Gammaproteobacteria bacterium]
MSVLPKVAALEGWFTLDEKEPQLLGSRCRACNTCYFPKQTSYCRNPACDSSEFDEVPLSRRGRVWSCTNAAYKPPEPFVAAEPFEPFTIAAVELEAERMVILGQVVRGVEVTDLKVGQEMELVLDTLYTDAESEKMIWKWKPVA